MPSSEGKGGILLQQESEILICVNNNPEETQAHMEPSVLKLTYKDAKVINVLSKKIPFFPAYHFWFDSHRSNGIGLLRIPSSLCTLSLFLLLAQFLHLGPYTPKQP